MAKRSLFTGSRAVKCLVLLCVAFSLVALSRSYISSARGDSARSLYRPFHEHLAVLSHLDVRSSDDPVGDKLGQPDIYPSEEHLVTGRSAMVASDVPLCSVMGKVILAKGGNAADAAVTVALCIGSVNSHSSGIGGGAFIVSTQANDSITIDAREIAPARAEKNMYASNSTLSQIGGLAVGVPGELAGLHLLYEQHGSGNMTWEDLIRPVIKLNRVGWDAPEVWVSALNKTYSPILSKVPILSENWDFIFKGKDRRLVQEGDRIRRPNLANTLELIAKNGSAAIFYDPEGPIAPILASTAQDLGGILQVSDFEQYSPNLTPALSFNFSLEDKNYEVLTTGGASSGLALLAGLNFYSAVSQQEPVENQVLEVHRVIEAMKWTSAVRSHLGDVNETYWKEVVDEYTDPSWAEAILDEGLYSDNTTFGWKHYEPLYEVEGMHGTSHFTVVDQDGGAVGMTTTVNLLFGSKVYDNQTGIILNNEMDDFSQPGRPNAFNLTPSGLNYIRPFKRPLSLMSPTIIKKEGEVELLVGAAGGSRIVTAILHAIIRNIFQGIPLLETIAYPRLHHQLIPEYVLVENSTTFEMEYVSFVECIECQLEEKNHTFKESGALTAMNAIKRTGRVWQGVSDYWRKRGRANGF